MVEKGNEKPANDMEKTLERAARHRREWQGVMGPSHPKKRTREAQPSDPEIPLKKRAKGAGEREPVVGRARRPLPGEGEQERRT